MQKFVPKNKLIIKLNIFALLAFICNVLLYICRFLAKSNKFQDLATNVRINNTKYYQHKIEFISTKTLEISGCDGTQKETTQISLRSKNTQIDTTTKTGLTEAWATPLSCYHKNEMLYQMLVKQKNQQRFGNTRRRLEF